MSEMPDKVIEGFVVREAPVAAARESTCQIAQGWSQGHMRVDINHIQLEETADEDEIKERYAKRRYSRQDQLVVSGSPVVSNDEKRPEHGALREPIKGPHKGII